MILLIKTLMTTFSIMIIITSAPYLAYCVQKHQLFPKNDSNKLVANIIHIILLTISVVALSLIDTF